MELIQKLGIDWRLLIAQIVNFVILLAILYKFMYKPVLGMLQKRTERIDKSLEEAKNIEDKIRNIEELKSEEITRARQEAQKIVEDAKKVADRGKADTVAKAKAEVEKVVAKAKESMAVEKEKMMGEVMDRAVELVTVASSKVLGETMDARANEKLIKESVSQAAKQS